MGRTVFFLLEIVGKHSSNGLQDAKKETVEKVVSFMGSNGLLDNEGRVVWDWLILFLSDPDS